MTNLSAILYLDKLFVFVFQLLVEYAVLFDRNERQSTLELCGFALCGPAC